MAGRRRGSRWRGSEALTPFPFALGLEQDRTEQLLVEGLAEHGRGVEWNTELGALVVDGDGGATAVVRRADGTEDTISARWVVGADGASSPVRHAAGLGFVGKTYAQTGLLATWSWTRPPGRRWTPARSG